MKEEEEILFGWLFHYNPYKKRWFAFLREEHRNYFNGCANNLVSHKDFDEVIVLAVAKDKKLSKDV